MKMKTVARGSREFDRLYALRTVYVCEGEPACPFADDEAITNAREGCTRCTRVAIENDGSETHYRLLAH
jgi:hypothetical protein